MVALAEYSARFYDTLLPSYRDNNRASRPREGRTSHAFRSKKSDLLDLDLDFVALEFILDIILGTRMRHEIVLDAM